MNDELERRVAERTATLLERERELRSLAEALKNADRRKDQFLATLAHELRNPLAPLRNGLQLLNLSEDTAVADETRKMMERQLSHMVRLIDDLLDVSRITSDKLILRKEHVLLREVIDAAMEASRPMIAAGGHSVKVAVPEEPVWFSADPTRLAEVVSNLLTNASKYTPEGGSIELEAERDDCLAIVRVKDNGLGIPPEMLDEVFDMFTQVNRTLHRARGGWASGWPSSSGWLHCTAGRFRRRAPAWVAAARSQFGCRSPWPTKA